LGNLTTDRAAGASPERGIFRDWSPERSLRQAGLCVTFCVEMPSRTKREFANAAGAADDALSSEDLVHGVLEPLRRATASSGALMYRYDESGTLSVVGGGLVEAMPEYAAELFHLDPVQNALIQRSVMTAAVIPRLFRELDWRAYQRGPAYNEFYRRHGIEDMLGMTLTDRPYGAPLMTGILLTRSRYEPAYDDDLRLRLSRLRPRLCSAQRRVERVARLEKQRMALELALEVIADGPVVVTDASGALVHASNRAKKFFGCDEFARPLSNTPGAFTGSSGAVAARISVDVTENRSRVVGLKAGSGDGFVVATLDVAAHSEDTKRRIASQYKLTAAESRVLQLVAEGLSNAEIARRLFVSVETVRTHVHRVLSKLGARSRAQAAAMTRRG
jgi:DNA-binding CsgD family transcriptional regulator